MPIWLEAGPRPCRYRAGSNSVLAGGEAGGVGE